MGWGQALPVELGALTGLTALGLAGEREGGREGGRELVRMREGE